MPLKIEKAQIMFKLAKKRNWKNKYDRLEHFKRFPNLKQIIKELSRQGWIIVHKKPNYIGISLDNSYKKEILRFIEFYLPDLKGIIK